MGVEPKQLQQKWQPVLRPELRESREAQQLQQKWEPVLRPELRENKELEHVGEPEFAETRSRCGKGRLAIVPAAHGQDITGKRLIERSEQKKRACAL